VKLYQEPPPCSGTRALPTHIRAELFPTVQSLRRREAGMKIRPERLDELGGRQRKRFIRDVQIAKVRIHNLTIVAQLHRKPGKDGIG
jgi:hypothetical protein